MNFLLRYTSVERRKLEIFIPRRWHWTHGNLPLRITWWIGSKDGWIVNVEIEIIKIMYCTYTIRKCLLGRMRSAGLTYLVHINILQWWPDHRLQFPDHRGLAGNAFCVMAPSTANERVFGVDGSCREKPKSKFTRVPEWTTYFFTIVLREGSAGVWLGFTCFLAVCFKTIVGFSNELLSKLPLAMKHITWDFGGFQTHSGGLGRKQCRLGGCAGRGIFLRVRSGSGQTISICAGF